MTQVKNILFKEFKEYFTSPIAYIVIVVFLLATGFVFIRPFFAAGQATMRPFFYILPWLFALIVPAITMRLFSEEVSIGSYEVLYTLPVSLADIVLGKFFAATVFIIVMLIPTMCYPICIAFFGTLDTGAVIGGYIGAILMGAAYSAIGIFSSTLTRNQIIAFIISLFICLFLTIVDKTLVFFPQPIVEVLSFIGTGFHFENISKGIVDTRDILYFLSVIFIGLFCSTLTMNEKN